MSLIGDGVSAVRKALLKYPALAPVADALYAVHYHATTPRSEKDAWQSRLRDVMTCADNDLIPRVPDAGRRRLGLQTMHNGLKIASGSYFGYAVTKMLELNRGVHEPQEERVFLEVLKRVPPGGCMIELGAFWGFYSLWFHQVVPDPTCYLIEPSGSGVLAGQRNFAINNFKGTFHQAFIGDAPKSPPGEVPTVSVDAFVRDRGIPHVHLLHSDIQGFEMQMLDGASDTLRARKIDYLFISTHGNDLHARCTDLLKDLDFHIVASADLDQTYSYDGLIVARRAELAGLDSVPIALKPKPVRAAEPA